MSDVTIDTISFYVLKIGKGEEEDRDFRSTGAEYRPLPTTDYYLQEAGFVYSEYAEHLLVKVTTDDGTHGWGEVQAPVVPEVAATVIETLAGPILLGEDPLDTASLWDRMYESMNIRGHFQGFMIDAMAGLDIALWDLQGKLLGESVATLLGGRKRDELPAYVTGGGTTYLSDGYAGIKVGVHGRDDVPLDRELQEVEDPSRIKVDCHWRFETAHDALLVGRELEEFGVGFVEAPLTPEDIDGAARVADALDCPVALGESLRTAHDFRLRLDRDAVDIGQPDINRTGLTEGRRIADLFHEYGRPVAPHMSASLGPGIAATWQLSSRIRNFQIQEHQGGLVEKANRFLDPGLTVRSGRLVVPDGVGLGIDVDEDALDDVVTESGTIDLPSEQR